MIKVYTLKENRTATKEEFLLGVIDHLTTQRQKSQSATGRCSYRGEEGRMCAFGPRIPRTRYEPRLEGLTCFSREIWEVTELPYGLVELAEACQKLHDHYYPHEWPGKFREIALKYIIKLDKIAQKQLKLMEEEKPPVSRKQLAK